jgi:transposase
VKVHDTKRGRKFGRTNAAAALNGGRVIAPCCYTGTTTAVVFEDWFATQRLPSLREGSTVILDNARFHRKKEPDKLTKEAKVRLLFLPPY